MLLLDEAFEGHVAAVRDAERQRQRWLTRAPLDHREERHRTADILRDLLQRFVSVFEERFEIGIDALGHGQILTNRE